MAYGNYTDQLSENLKNEKVHLSFEDNIWGADVADMKLISKYDKEFQLLLCVIYISCKYSRVILLKDKIQ